MAYNNSVGISKEFGRILFPIRTENASQLDDWITIIPSSLCTYEQRYFHQMKIAGDIAWFFKIDDGSWLGSAI